MREVPQRELRNDISAVLRDVSAGESVAVTVRGKTVAELHPPRRRALTPRARVATVLARTPEGSWLGEVLADRDADEHEERSPR